MTGYLQTQLGLDEPSANALRVQYWQRYGATLLGVIQHHPEIDPKHFLWHTHQFPQLHSMLVFERGLRGLLLRLPGKKILFSNAPAHYAKRVLGAMGVAVLFGEVICIERTGFRPKPSAHGFRQILCQHGIEIGRAHV